MEIEEVRSVMEETLQKYLDNFISIIPSPPDGKEDNDTTMNRAWVNIGSKEHPVMKHLSGKTQDELNDRIVQAYVNSGRVWEFLRQNTAPEDEAGKTFREYVETWLSVYKAKKVRANTMKDYKTMLNKYLLPAFGDREFRSITTDDFQMFLNEHADLSRKYLTSMKILFGSISKDAVEDGIIEHDPTDSRKLFIPSKKETKRTALEKDDFLDVVKNISTLKGRHYLLMALLTMSGLRRGEILGLKWEDFFWDKGYIFVQRAVTFGTGVSVVGETKTDCGRRKVPIIKELREFLEPFKDEGFVIYARDKNKPICSATFVRDWREIRKTIDLHGATPHVFRHTFLTLLAATGVDVKTIQAIAGHSSSEITMRVYVHPVNNNIVQAGDIFSKSIMSSVDWSAYTKLAEENIFHDDPEEDEAV